MIDIGILGLDTSHAETFAPILEGIEIGEDGESATVAAVYDDEGVRSEDYVQSFCVEWAATRYDDPEAMVAEVDAAMVLAVDWQRHLELARPFLAAGVPTLIDKPVVGSAADLRDLADLAASGTLVGGSSVPYHPAFERLRRPDGNRTLHVVGYNDFYYYRVHALDTLRRLAGAEWRRVEPVPDTDASVVTVTFEDGSWGTVRLDGPTEPAAFGAMAASDRVDSATVDATEETLQEMYRPFLRAFLEAVLGDTDPTKRVLSAARLGLAAERALAEERAIARGRSALRGFAVPSEEFVAEYEPYY